MSKEKLYAVNKNRSDEFWDFFNSSGFWALDVSCCPTTPNKELAELVADEHGGHVVTFVEEPEKVTVSTNEAKAIESLLNANTYIETLDPFRYLFTSRYKEDIKRLIKAIKNGYTVAKEKKYRLPVPKSWCGDNDHYWRKESDGTLTWSILSGRAEDFEFTKDEIGKFELQYCEKEEVTDDE
ncbi:DUF1642 domain-containing protein [Lacticaseibacillus rhamnosus]|uniref:DUF1642 domain-containing protein n=1 Tax=Lacticaseibacillus rhamnosus TaxID=47715 RepID=UPI00237F82EC|nr:DUF1642 domain-containing protein [Lacticaseibacillus rhamnosus]MDE3301583.1 DUF1642 domain-containing protein [Lacticaseibacillus rhamnosus]